ncbi:MAG: hypothetical protein CM15mV14_1460 [uncultured marine virus]|nr:MAG: hypothetical protein CM15mV14_1460 [uncultured marine virus]
MPNWCRNRVTVYGNEEEVSKVVDIFESKDTVFGKIIPSPDWKNIPNERESYQKWLNTKIQRQAKFHLLLLEFPDGTNDSRWYDWNIANWDTKWDIAGSVEIEEEDSEIVEINFSTAWSPPEAICSKLREMFPDLSFSWFYDEPGMELAGYL